MSTIGVIILTCGLLSLFNTFSLLFFVLVTDRSRKFYALTVSSFFTTISLFILYFDIDALVNGSTNLVATFFTFLTLATALVILVRALVLIRDKNGFLPFSIRLLYTLLGAGLITLATYLEIPILRSISYYLIVVLPLSVLVFKYFLKDDKLKRSYVFYLTIAILVIATVNLVYLIIYRIGNPYGEIPLIEVFSSVIIAIIQISMYLAIVLELIAKDVKNLNDQNLLLELSNQKIKRISETDTLTELYNRRKMNEIIQSHYQTSINSSKTFSIVIMDADNFKSINDIYGHNEGDEVLKYISRSLKNILRKTDFIGRWGGDEFIVLLPDFSKRHVTRVKEKIHEYFNKYPYKNKEIIISLSIGIAHYHEGFTLEEIIHNADAMMYKNKAKKKNNK